MRGLMLERAQLSRFLEWKIENLEETDIFGLQNKQSLV